MFLERALLWALLLAHPVQDPKDPPPDAVAIKEAEQALKELYKDEYKLKLPKDRVAFAEKLLRQAAETKKDPAARWVMLREVLALAADERELALAFAAADQLSRTFADVRAVEHKAAALARARAAAKSADEAARLPDFYLQLAEEAGEAHEYGVVQGAAEDIDRVARAVKNPGLIQKAAELLKAARELKSEHETARPAELKLQVLPDDADACAAWGRFLCVFKSSWERGLPFLAKGPSERGPHVDLCELARSDVAAKESKTQYAAGEKWCTWSGKAKSPLEKRNTLTRGRQLLTLAHAGADGLLKARIEKRLKETEPAGGAGGVDLLRLIDPKKDVVAGEWRFEGGSLVCAALMPNARVAIPYAPPEEYDLSAVVEKKEGWSLIFGLPRGDAQFAVAFDGFPPIGISGIGLIDGKWIDQNETSKRGVFLPLNKPVALLIAVRRTGITVSLDGKVFCSWQGNYTRLALPPNYQVPQPKSIILSAYDARYAVSKLQLTAVSGTGRPLR